MWRSVPAAAGGSVMATGIVSIGLRLDGRHRLADAFLVVTAVLWLAMAAVFVERLACERDQWSREAAGPASLTGVAGTAVLGTGLAMEGWPGPAWALTALAAATWAVLLPRVLRNWSIPLDGACFLATVATQALAVLLATLAQEQDLTWPADAALVLLLAGIALYLAVLLRFDARQVGVGSGDHWVLGGAAAITAVAAARVQLAGVAAAFPGMLAWAAWGWAMGCLVVLAAAEIARPRLRYDVRRWATAFPVGMYAAASFALATAEHTTFPLAFARLCVWGAVAVWLAVATGAVRRAANVARRHGDGRDDGR